MTGLRLLRVGRSAVLAEVGSVQRARRLYAEARRVLEAAGTTGTGLRVTDVVPAAETVLFDGVSDLPHLERWLSEVSLDDPSLDDGSTGVVVDLPTRYDGVDLAEVAQGWGMSEQAAVAAHAGFLHEVAFCGFVPGFAYCTGLPAERAVARLSRPRTRVPAGSVAVAGVFTGVYPRESPGGWRLLGTTSVSLWDPAAAQPALLVPGTRVRFLPEG